MSSKKGSRLLAYLGVPAVFCAMGYLVIFLALQPVWGTLTAYAGFFISDKAPDFNHELANIYDPNAEKPEPKSDPKAENPKEKWVDGNSIEFPLSGEQYGQITCDQIGLDAPVYWYDSDDILAVGVGQSLISLLPGFGRSIILAGHNTTFFNCLNEAQPGNVIKFGTNYGDYEYTVTAVEVYAEEELESFLLSTVDREQEELIMYTCYPFYPVPGRKTERLVVFADRTAGPNVTWREQA